MKIFENNVLFGVMIAVIVLMVVLEVIARGKLASYNMKPKESYLTRLIRFIIYMLIFYICGLITSTIFIGGMVMISCTNINKGLLLFCFESFSASVLISVGALFSIIVLTMILYSFYHCFISIEGEPKRTMEEKR